MATGKRVLTIFAALAGITVLGWVLLIGAVFAYGGVMTVRVQDTAEGTNLYIPVPVALVDAAVATGATLIPRRELDDLIEIHADLGDWQPALRDVLRALDEAPDVTLVEVDDGPTHVVVRKVGRTLRVDVREPGLAVRVSVPTRFASRTVSRILG